MNRDQSPGQFFVLGASLEIDRIGFEPLLGFPDRQGDVLEDEPLADLTVDRRLTLRLCVRSIR